MTRLRLRVVAPIMGLTIFFSLIVRIGRIGRIGEYKLVKPSTALREILRSRAYYWTEVQPSVRALLSSSRSRS